MKVGTLDATKQQAAAGETEVSAISEDRERTMVFPATTKRILEARDILGRVYGALREKGYNPVGQIAGFLLSGDPVYITAHNNARSLVRRLDRMEVLEELVRFYVENAVGLKE